MFITLGQVSGRVLKETVIPVLLKIMVKFRIPGNPIFFVAVYVF